MRKGHKDFATLVTTRDEVDGIRILAVLKGRKKDTVKKIFSVFPIGYARRFGLYALMLRQAQHRHVRWLY